MKSIEGEFIVCTARDTASFKCQMRIFFFVGMNKEGQLDLKKMYFRLYFFRVFLLGN